MNSLFTFLSNPLLERLGWTLVHSVWECTLAALALAVMLTIVRGSSGRYVICCVALIVALCAPVVTFAYLGVERPTTKPPSVLMQPIRLAAVPDAQPAPVTDVSKVPLNPLPWSAVVWIVGVAGLTVRHVGGWISVQRLRRQAKPMDPLACFERLMRRLGIQRAVMLAQSVHVSVPSVVGWWRPVVLMPYSALTGLSPAYLESLLAHELAHVRRHDYLINLIQTAIETLLFYHPAVWWISRHVRQEREHCCDDLAVAVINGDRRGYAEALAAMEQLRITSNPLAMASNGGSLLQRIRRLAAPRPPRASLLWPGLLMLGIAIGLAACSQVGSPQAKAQEQTAATPAPAPTAALVAEPAPAVGPRPAAAPAVPVRAAPGNPFAPYDPMQNAYIQVDQTAKLQAMEADLAAQRARLAQAQAQFGDKHPQVNQLQSNVEQSIKMLEDAQLQFQRSSNPIPSEYYISGVGQSGTIALGDKQVTLAEAIAAAKPPDGLDQKHLVVVHRLPVSGRTIELFGAASPDLANMAVRAGDVIMLTDKIAPEIEDEAMGPRVTIQGEVPKPGKYAWHPGMTILQALVAAGVNPPDAPDQVVSLRPGKMTPFESGPLTLGKLVGKQGNRELRPGETITVGKSATGEMPPQELPAAEGPTSPRSVR